MLTELQYWKQKCDAAENLIDYIIRKSSGVELNQVIIEELRAKWLDATMQPYSPIITLHPISNTSAITLLKIASDAIEAVQKLQI